MQFAHYHLFTIWDEASSGFLYVYVVTAYLFFFDYLMSHIIMA